MIEVVDRFFPGIAGAWWLFTHPAVGLPIATMTAAVCLAIAWNEMRKGPVGPPWL